MILLVEGCVQTSLLGGNFCVQNVCGNFYLQKHIIADYWKNRKN